MTEKTILVVGATGHQGGAAVRRLLADGWRVRALTRDPASETAKELERLGARLMHGDLNDRRSLDAAVAGAHGVFSVQPGALGVRPVAFEDETRWGRSLADAAAAAGVAHLIYASVAGAEHSSGVRAFEAKWEIERYLGRIGLPATILRPVSFMENYTDPAFGVQTGSLATPFVSDVPEQLIAVEDIGVFAGLAFGNPSEFLGKAVTIAGDELTPPQTAAALSRATGRQIPYLPVPIETVRAQSKDLADAADFLNNRGGYRADISASRRLHPALMDFDTWLERYGKAQLTALFNQEEPPVGVSASSRKPAI